jgi:adenosine deaminase CECR1
MYIDLEKLKNLKLYKIIKKMPKGILLNTHLSTIANIADFVFYLKKEYNNEFKNIYYVSNEQSIITYKNKLNSLESDISNKLNDLVLTGGDSSKIEILFKKYTIISKNKNFNIPLKKLNILNGLSYFTNGPPCDGWTQISTKSNTDIRSIINFATRMQNKDEYNWENLEKYVHNYWSLIKNINIFDKYFNFVLQEVKNDKLMGIELRTNIGSVYDRKLHNEKYYTDENGETYPFYTGSWEKEKELEIMERIITERSKEIYCSLIIVSHRHKRVEQFSFNFKDDITKKCNDYDKLDQKYKDIIKSIDIVGNEKDGEENISVINILKKKCKNLNYCINSGQTNLSTEINKNLISILELTGSDKLIRVGHGLSLVNNENLMKLYKDLNIHVEICPLSNYILGYVNNIEEHPGKKLLENNISISISNDNPSIYNYDYVTFDWLFIVALWKLDFNNILKLIINSIKFSSINKEKKEEFYKKVYTQFNEYIKQFEESFIEDRDIAYNELQKYKKEEKKGGYYEKYLKYKKKYINLKYIF